MHAFVQSLLCMFNCTAKYSYEVISQHISGSCVTDLRGARN